MVTYTRRRKSWIVSLVNDLNHKAGNLRRKSQQGYLTCLTNYYTYLRVQQYYLHTYISSITITRVRQVSVERHLVNDALAYSPLVGNNTGVCSLTVRASVSLQEGSCNLPGVCGPCVLRREKLVSYQFYQHIMYHTHTHTHTICMYIHFCTIRCYFVCTHNRIRSPRLAAFGRIETRWVREVGKFGPYLRYKDWLRR